MLFKDRKEAGVKLAERLTHLAGKSEILVLGLPRGGVVVAHELAERLGFQMDVFVVRKLGVPFHPELAMGAIAMPKVRVMNEDVIRSLKIPSVVIEKVIRKETLELERRIKLYRGSRPFPKIEGRDVILVDDGLATGASMNAATLALAELQAKRIMIAVPVAPREVYEEFKKKADEVICLHTPEIFESVGSWYENFEQVIDEEVTQLLAK